MEPTVSIVLPVYNGEAHLRASIESVVCQTYTDWELILVDDCSTDSTLSIMQSYQDKRIRILHNEHNLRLPASLNRGFREARGRYLSWTSHDNRMEPGMIEEMVRYLDSHPQEALVTACYSAFSLRTGQTLYEVHHPDPQIHLPLFNCVCYAFLYRRSAAEEVGEYDESLFLVEDYDYWLRLWMRYPIGKIDRVLYHTGVGEETLTSSRKEEIAQMLLRLRLLYFEKLDAALCPYPALRRRLHTEMADAMPLRQSLHFAAERGAGFLLNYICIHRPKKMLRKIRRKLCHA